MRPEKIKEEFLKLNLAQQLLLLQDIWDAIARDNETLPFPEWQKQELSKRYKEYQNGRQNLHDWHRVHEDLKNNP